MKIFISGIAGFLGSHLADALIAQGHDVVGCDNLAGGYMDNVPEKAAFYHDDCTDLAKMKEIMAGCDVVVHTAAAAYEGFSMSSPCLVNKNVHQTTVVLATAAIHNKVKRFVFCSSTARYGSNKAPFTEDMEPKPMTPYGVAKVASEQVLKNLCDYYGMEYVIAVPHSIIGTRQKYDDPYRNVASIFINLMLQGRQPMIYGDGEQKRCFSMVQDCIQCLTKMVLEPGLNGEVINIGPDESHSYVTVNELAQMLAKMMDFDLKPEYQGSRPHEMPIMHCSADKARKLLGYKTEWTLEKGLKEMIDWIKERGPRPFRYHFDVEIINEKTPKTWSKKLF